MKMKMKMTLVAGALALAVAGQANAAIVQGESSSLVLSIWDTSSNTSYVSTLGALDFSSFATLVSGTPTALTAGSAAIGDMTFAANATLTSFLAGVTQATTVWNVQAVDSLGTSAFGQKALVTTTNTNIKSAANSLASAQQNKVLLDGLGLVNGYYTAVNGAATANALTFPVTLSSVDGAAYAGTTTASNLQNAYGKLTFNTTAAIGSALNFWYLTPSSTAQTAKASVAQFNGGAAAATWTLDQAGNLTFAAGAPAVAPVPEPGEWLLMLSGLALIGFIATRRKEEGSMTFA